MNRVPHALQGALESDCGHSLESIIESGRPEDFEALLEVVQHPADSEELLKALHLLGRWGDPRAVAPIKKLLPQLPEIERARAMDALGRIGGTEALKAVLDYEKDSSPQVRKFVAYALSRMEQPEARRALKRLRETDPVDFVRKVAGQRLSGE